jgi:hypothetical protein
MTAFRPTEKKRIDALLADADFREVTSRQDQIAIAEKQLRGFLDLKCMTFSASKFNRLTNRQSGKVAHMLSAWFVVSAPHHNTEAFTSMGSRWTSPGKSSKGSWISRIRTRGRGLST